MSQHRTRVDVPSSTVRPDYAQLDSLRALAALLVVLTHTAFWAGTYTAGTLGALTQRLEVGVAIFFALSGFLLGRPYVRAAVLGESHDPLGRYLWKRALRILPVYWVCVVAAFALVGTNRDLGAGRVVQNLALVDLYRAEQLPQGLTQMWSLTVELAFYVALPFLGLLLVRLGRGARRPARRVAVALAVLALLSATWNVTSHAVDTSWAPWAARWLPSYLTWFVGGLAIALVEAAGPRGRVASAVTAVAHDRLACFGGAAVVLVLASTPLGGDPSLVQPTASEALVRHLAYGVVAVLLLAPCVLDRRGDTVARVLAHPALRHVGHLSYSLFCCHMLVLYLLAPRVGLDLFQSSWPVVTAVVLLVSLLVAELLYRYVELPFLRLKSWSWPRADSRAPSDTPTSS